MNQIIELTFYSAKAVGTILLVACAGVFLVRLRYLKDESLKVLSHVVYAMMVPCLLFTKVSGSINLDRLKEWFILPVSGIIFVCLGLVFGFIVVKICNPRRQFRNSAVAACGFANSGFIPISLIVAVTTVFPVFQDKEAAALGISYISIYLLAQSPLLWTFGYSLIVGKNNKEVTFLEMLPPPVIGLLLGLVVGFVPFLHFHFCSSEGFLNPIFSAAEIVAKGAVPCVLIVLGGKLAYGPIKGSVNTRTVIGIITAKMIILPLLALCYVKLLRGFSFVPAGSLFALVLIIEAASPPANNLIVMCALKNENDNKNEEAMSTLLFWNYIVAVPILTFFIMLSMWLFG